MIEESLLNVLLSLSLSQFQDHVNDVVTGSTFIIVDIYYVNDGQEQTSTHNWHIHESPSIDGMECAPTIDGHYNPFMVSLCK